MTVVINGTTGITNDGGYTGDGVVFADTTPANTLVTTTGGNVGIGTSSPGTKLVVGALATGTLDATYKGNIRIQGFETTLESQGGLELKMTEDGYGAKIQTLSSGGTNLVFATRNASATWTERARISSNGEFLIGTTAGGGSLSVGTSSSTQVIARQGSSGQTFFSLGSAAAGTGWAHFNGVSSNNTVQNILIYGNGNIQNANNSYGAISDVKLKENVTDATPKLEKLQQVRIVSYNLKGNYEQHKQLGVIAQELEQIFPGMVEETPDRDVEGNDLGTTTKSVKYSVFVPMLIKAIQEQQAMIVEMKAELDALKAKVGA